LCKTVLREKARFLQKLPVFLGLLTLQRKVGESLFCINTLGEQSCLAHAALSFQRKCGVRFNIARETTFTAKDS